VRTFDLALRGARPVNLVKEKGRPIERPSSVIQVG